MTNEEHAAVLDQIAVAYEQKIHVKDWSRDKARIAACRSGAAALRKYAVEDALQRANAALRENETLRRERDESRPMKNRAEMQDAARDKIVEAREVLQRASAALRENDSLRRERDEARAECERLRDVITEHIANCEAWLKGENP